MNSFIPEPDRPAFELFLHQYGLSPAKSSQHLPETKVQPNPTTADTQQSCGKYLEDVNTQMNSMNGKYLEDVNTQMNSILSHE